MIMIPTGIFGLIFSRLGPYSMLLDCAHGRNKNITGNFCKTIAQIKTTGVIDKKSLPNKSITMHF